MSSQTESGVRLEHVLSWRLAVAGRLLKAVADERLAQPGTGAQGGGVLIRLAEGDGLTQVELARLQHLEPPSMCRIIDRLQQDGLVERRKHPSDRRATCVYLTPEGTDAAGRCLAVAAELDDEMFSDLDPEERSAVLSALERAMDRLLIARAGV